MAKMNGFVGGLSGKFGNAVFRQRGGKTIAAQYQPVVANPSTEGQRTQRTKFKLLSQLGAIFGPHLGGFSTQSRGNKAAGTQRNAFFKANYPSVAIKGDNNEIAYIAMDQIKLTDSFRTLGTAITANIPRDNDAIEITINKSDPTIELAHVVVAVYTGDGMGVNERPARIAAAGNYRVADSLIQVPFNVVSGISYTVLVYGIIPLNNGATNDYDNIYSDSELYESGVSLQRDILTGNVAVTETLGTNFIGSSI